MGEGWGHGGVTSSEKVFAANTFLGKGLQFFEDVLHRAREMLSSQLTPTRIAALTGSMCFRALRVAVVVLVLVVIALPLVALGQETAESHTLELAASAQTGLPYALVVGAEARVFETVSVGVQYGAFFSWGPRTLHGDDGISAVRWHGDGWTSLNATLEGGLCVRTPSRRASCSVGARRPMGGRLRRQQPTEMLLIGGGVLRPVCCLGVAVRPTLGAGWSLRSSAPGPARRFVYQSRR